MQTDWCPALHGHEEGGERRHEKGERRGERREERGERRESRGRREERGETDISRSSSSSTSSPSGAIWTQASLEHQHCGRRPQAHPTGMAWEASGPGRGRLHVHCQEAGCDADTWSCDCLGEGSTHCLRAQGWKKARTNSHRYCPRHGWDWDPPNVDYLWCEHRHPYSEWLRSVEGNVSLPPLSLPAPPSPPRSARVVADTPESEGRGAASESPSSSPSAAASDVVRTALTSNWDLQREASDVKSYVVSRRAASEGPASLTTVVSTDDTSPCAPSPIAEPNPLSRRPFWLEPFGALSWRGGPRQSASLFGLDAALVRHS